MLRAFSVTDDSAIQEVEYIELINLNSMYQRLDSKVIGVRCFSQSQFDDVVRTCQPGRENYDNILLVLKKLSSKTWFLVYKNTIRDLSSYEKDEFDPICDLFYRDGLITRYPLNMADVIQQNGFSLRIFVDKAYAVLLKELPSSDEMVPSEKRVIQESSLRGIIIKLLKKEEISSDVFLEILIKIKENVPAYLTTTFNFKVNYLGVGISCYVNLFSAVIFSNNLGNIKIFFAHLSKDTDVGKFVDDNPIEFETLGKLACLRVLFDEKRYDMAAVLLGYGANPNVNVNHMGNSYCNLLPYLIHQPKTDEQAISMLLGYKVDLNPVLSCPIEIALSKFIKAGGKKQTLEGFLSGFKELRSDDKNWLLDVQSSLINFLKKLLSGTDRKALCEEFKGFKNEVVIGIAYNAYVNIIDVGIPVIFELIDKGKFSFVTKFLEKDPNLRWLKIKLQRNSERQEYFFLPYLIATAIGLKFDQIKEFIEKFFLSQESSKDLLASSIKQSLEFFAEQSSLTPYFCEVCEYLLQNLALPIETSADSLPQEGCSQYKSLIASYKRMQSAMDLALRKKVTSLPQAAVLAEPISQTPSGVSPVPVVGRALPPPPPPPLPIAVVEKKTEVVAPPPGQAALLVAIRGFNSSGLRESSSAAIATDSAVAKKPRSRLDEGIDPATLLTSLSGLRHGVAHPHEGGSRRQHTRQQSVLTDVMQKRVATAVKQIRHVHASTMHEGFPIDIFRFASIKEAPSYKKPTLILVGSEKYVKHGDKICLLKPELSGLIKISEADEEYNVVSVSANVCAQLGQLMKGAPASSCAPKP